MSGFSTRKPTSEFTHRALDGQVKEVERLTGICKTDLYAMLAGQKPDHLDYARDIHRALCTCNPEAAAEYRELLAADGALLERTKGVGTADEDALFYLCQKLAATINRAGRGKAEREDVLSEARKLFNKLGTFINANVIEMSPAERRREAGLGG